MHCACRIGSVDGGRTTIVTVVVSTVSRGTQQTSIGPPRSTQQRLSEQDRGGRGGVRGRDVTATEAVQPLDRRQARLRFPARSVALVVQTPLVRAEPEPPGARTAAGIGEVTCWSTLAGVELRPGGHARRPRRLAAICAHSPLQVRAHRTMRPMGPMGPMGPIGFFMHTPHTCGPSPSTGRRLAQSPPIVVCDRLFHAPSKSTEQN